MKRFLSLLLAMTLLLGLGCFALPQGAEAAAPKYDTWREAYTALLTDETLRKTVIGKDADYREDYFSSDLSLLQPTAYAAADINADGTPELLLYAEGTGLTDLFAFDGRLHYLGYDRIFGFLPEEGLAVIHGHWHGAGGSGTAEYSVRDFFRDGEQTAYLDRLDTGEELHYSFFETEEGWSEGTDEKAAARYDELYDRYVRACVRMEDIPLFAMDNLSGFLSPTVVKYIRRLYNAVGTLGGPGPGHPGGGAAAGAALRHGRRLGSRAAADQWLQKAGGAGQLDLPLQRGRRPDALHRAGPAGGLCERRGALRPRQ